MQTKLQDRKILDLAISFLSHNVDSVWNTIELLGITSKEIDRSEITGYNLTGSRRANGYQKRIRVVERRLRQEVSSIAKKLGVISKGKPLWNSNSLFVRICSDGTLEIEQGATDNRQPTLTFFDPLTIEFVEMLKKHL